MSRIITVTSGKGGVGKTSISLNLSLSLASKGFSVCLFDADLGLANVSVLTGIHPEKDLESVICGECTMADIMIKDFNGIDIIPGSSGVEKIADLTKTQTAKLISNFLDLEDYDYFIFDTSAGISSQVLSFCMTSQEIILVVTEEPTSLTDAYAMLKVLSKHNYNHPVKLLVNRVKKAAAAKKAYLQLKKTTNKFLNVKLEPLGIIASDPMVQKAVFTRTPFTISSPSTVAAKCIQNVTDKLIYDYYKVDDVPIELFWGRCLSFFNSHAAVKTQNQKTENQKERETKPPVKDEQIKKGSPLSEDASGFNKRLFNIESKLTDLLKEVDLLKALVKDQHLKSEKTQVAVESWRNTKRISLEHEPDLESVVPSEPTILHTSKNKSEEPIVRGQLRNPTQEELDNWNEAHNPVVLNTDLQKRRYH